MHPAILADFLEKTIRVGGFQLGQHPIFHDGRNDRVLVFQFLQNLSVGGVTFLGFLRGWKAKLIKEDFPQLLGRVNVEGSLRIGENHLFTGINALGEHGTELFQLIAVNADTPVFHLVEHVT